jgi:hypothetical protein
MLTPLNFTLYYNAGKKRMWSAICAKTALYVFAKWARNELLGS